MFGVGVLVASLLTIITPQMAYLNLWALVACRVVIGAFEVSNAMMDPWAFKTNAHSPQFSATYFHIHATAMYVYAETVTMLASRLVCRDVLSTVLLWLY